MSGTDSSELLEVVYQELRRIAAAQLRNERAGNTLQPTALVHEAYLRLFSQLSSQSWQNRRHFYSVAAESMRRILIEKARQKKSLKHGGSGQRQNLPMNELPSLENPEWMLELDEALTRLEIVDPTSALVVKLRFFAGFTCHEISEQLDRSERSVRRDWKFARTWLFRELQADDSRWSGES